MRMARLFAKVVVFGDSLSDTGNFFKATGRPPSPYYNGRFADGPLAVEVMADLLGLPLVNFAWGGATTGVGNHLDGGSVTEVRQLPGIRTVLDSALPTIDLQDALVVLWGGSNDALTPGNTIVPLEPATTLAVENLIYAVVSLTGAGARKIFMPGLPDLALTPFVRSLGQSSIDAARAFSTAVNRSLRERLAADAPNLLYFDTAALLQEVFEHPSANNFRDVSSPGITASANGASSGFLFWDDFHPSARAHAVLGERFAQACQA